MIALRQTPEFAKWMSQLRDKRAQKRIVSRILHLLEGRPGDHKHVGEGVWELRMHFGSGYRVYYTQRGREWVLLLAGGDKGSQNRDIRLAWKLAEKEREQHG